MVNLLDRKSSAYHLDRARNPLRSHDDRVDSYRQFEIAAWAEAVLERRFPILSIPTACYRDVQRLLAELREGELVPIGAYR